MRPKSNHIEMEICPILIAVEKLPVICLIFQDLHQKGAKVPQLRRVDADG